MKNEALSYTACDLHKIINQIHVLNYEKIRRKYSDEGRDKRLIVSRRGRVLS